jgi:uncharacterized damage-inducible protein DinB
MTMTDTFAADLHREAPLTKRTLEQVPDGKSDWKPHPKSMPLGSLATMVANLPEWVALTIELDELDLHPKSGPKYQPKQLTTSRELVETHEASVAKGLEALAQTTDAHLQTPWKLLNAGKLVYEQPRYIVLRDAVLSHLAHHRGQLTVYLRLTDAHVPSIYGPSGDEPLVP